MANRSDRPTWLAALACALLGGMCCTQTALAEDAPDVSAARKAAMAFCKAVAAGDMDKVHALSTGTDREYSLIKVLSDTSHAVAKFRDAATRKFGDQSKFFDDLQMDLAKDVETADIKKIDGDTATVIVKSKPDDKYPPTLKKDGNGWKMDLTNLDKDPDMVAASQKMLPNMTQVFNKMIKNINDDKYKTFTDLTNDFQKEFTTALTPPPDAPTPAPAPAPDAPKK